VTDTVSPAHAAVATLWRDAARYRRAVWLLALLALALRLFGLNWDGGRGLHPDEGNLVRAALSLGVGGRLLPEFHAYNDLALWLPRLVSLPFCDSNDGACLTLVARALSATLSAVLILPGAGVAFLLASADGDIQAGRIAGLVAAAALALSAPLVQWGHFGTTESAMALLVGLAWFLAAHWQAGHMTDRAFVLSMAVTLGVGFGFKTTALAVALLPVLALALSPRAPVTRLRLGVWLGVVALAQGLAFAPSVIFATEPWLAVMRFEGGVVDGSVPVFWTAQFTGTSPVVFQLGQLWSITQGAGFVLALLALWLMPRSGWRMALPGLAFALVYAALTFGWHAKFTRYLAPLLPIVLILAGVAIGRMAMVLHARSPLAAGLAGLGLMGLAGLDMASAYAKPDPRLAMEAVIASQTPPDSVIAVEPRDMAQLAGRRSVSLPLANPDLTPQTLAETLAQADWLVVASRRNWEVLPRQPGRPAAICAHYAGLVDGTLGFFPYHRTARVGLLGRLFAPGLHAEETRAVFDRPNMILFRKTEGLGIEELTNRLSAVRPSVDCAPSTLARVLGGGA